MNDCMLAALVDFECEYDGQIVTMQAGRSHVIEGHEIFVWA